MPPYGVRGGHSTAPPGAHRIYLSPPDQVFFSPTKFGPTPAGPRPPATPYSRSETRMLAARNAPLQRVSLETPTNRARLPTNAPAPHFSPALRDLATETTQAADRPTLGHATPSVHPAGNMPAFLSRPPAKPSHAREAPAAQGQAPSEAGAFIHFFGARCTGKPRAASPAWSIHPPGSRHRSAPPAHLGIYLEVIKRRGTIYGRRLPPSPFPRQMRWPLRRTPAFSSSPSSRPVRSIATYAAMPWRRLVLRQGLGTHHRAPGEEVPSTDAEAMIVFRPPICCLDFPGGTPGRRITPATSRPRLRTPAQHHYRNDASSRRKPVRRLSTTQDSSAGAILN